MAAPIQSNDGDLPSSRLSGTFFQVAQAATATSGTLMKNAARHEIVSTRTPPIRGASVVVAPDAPAQVPNARPCSSPEEVAVINASDAGTRSAPVAPGRTPKRLRAPMFVREPR